MKKLLTFIIVIIIIGVIGSSANNSYDSDEYSGSYDYTYDATENDEDSYTSYETSSYDYSDYNTTAPDVALFTSSDLIGRWTDSPGEEVGMFLDISYSGNQLSYDYYQIQYGNSISMNLANEKTKWEYCYGNVTTQPTHGTFMCMKSNGYESYVSFYYIDENTICHQGNGTYFYRVY